MSTRDHYKKNEDLDAAGLYQLAAEEAARPGKRTPKSTRVLRKLAEGLELFDAQVREIEALVEEKRRRGLLGGVRKFSRRQLYARAIRYTHWDGDPSPENARLLGVLRAASDLDEDDHEALLERLIDQGWAPPRPLTRRAPAPPGPAEPPVAEEEASTESRALERSDDAPAATPEARKPHLSRPTPPVPPPPAPGLAPDEAEEEESRSLDSVAMGQLSQESTDQAPFDPFETTGGLPRDSEHLRGGGGHPEPASRQQFVIGVLLGVLLVAVPTAFWLGTRTAPPTPKPRPTPKPATPTPSRAPEPTPEPSPTPPPSPPPTPEPPPDPLAALRKDLPDPGESPAGGRKLLAWLRARLEENAAESRKAFAGHQEARRADINTSFAHRNNQIFEAAQWGGGSGGYDPEHARQARELLREVKSVEERGPALVHATYLTLLGFYMDSARYPEYEALFRELAPELEALAKAFPEISGSGAGMVLRVIGEDLRDSDSEALAPVGLSLLQAL